MSKQKTNVPSGPNLVGRLLRNFWVNLLFVILGLLFGGCFKNGGMALQPFGHLYLAFLSMCIMPIVLTAVATGVGELLRQGGMTRFLKRTVVVYGGFVILGASVGLFAGWIAKPGEALDPGARKALGEMMLQLDPNYMAPSEHHGITGLLEKVIPKNAVKTLAEDRMLGIVFLSILMGIALGVSKSDETLRVLHFMKGILEIFKRILGWVLCALPFALFSLSASLIATSGWSILSILSRTLLLIYACCVVMCLVYLLTIHLATGHPFGRILRALRDALALAFFSNSLVAMPIAIQKLEKELRLPSTGVRLVLPLGVVMNRHIYPLLFALMAVLTVQVYGHSLGPGDVIHVVLTSALVGMAAVGNLAVVAPFVQEVIQPIGLPAGIAMIILTQSTAVVNPVVKMTQLFGACATTSVICAGSDKGAPASAGKETR